MLAKHVGPGKRYPDATPTQKRVGFRLGERFNGQFVTTGIQGADDHGVGCQGSGHPRVGLGLHSLAGNVAAIEEKKLGAVKANTFGTAVRNEVELLQQLDVCRNGEVIPVQRLGGGMTGGLQSAANGLLGGLQLPVMRQRLGRWMQNKPSGVAIENRRAQCGHVND